MIYNTLITLNPNNCPRFLITSHTTLDQQTYKQRNDPTVLGNSNLVWVFVGEVALGPNLSLGAGERVVLGEYSDGSRELLEEIGLALGHLFDVGFGARVGGELVVDEEEALVVEDVAVVIVVENHRSPAVVPHVLDRLRVGDRVRTLVQHVFHVARVQLRVHFRVQTVDQLHAVGPPHAVGSCVKSIYSLLV